MDSEKLPEREKIEDRYKWDLSPLFKSAGEWDELYTALQNRITGYEKFRNRLGESPELLREAIEFDLAVSRDLEKIYTFAHLQSDVDKSNQQNLAVMEKAISLYTRISELASYMTPEIHLIDDGTMASFRKSKALEPYAFMLEKILRDKPHTLSGEVEEILAMSGEIAIAPSQIFSQLDNVDITFGTIDDGTGRMIELSHGNFSTLLQSQSRGVREKAFSQYYRSYDALKHTLSAALSNSVKKDFFYSRVRKYRTCRESAMFSDNIPEEVYDTLVATVKKNLQPLFKYLDFRKKAIGVDALHFYDTYVPIIEDIEFRMPFEEAADTCVRALEVLGGEYTSVLHDGFAGGWVDRYENRGKRSGAYSSGCYDSPPYILINYKDDNINSLYTLIHEAGHSMHSYFSNRAQPYAYHGYSIFAAEVASTFNETLLTRYLLDRYKDDPRMTAYLLNREIDNIRATLYRQTMFAEFEAAAHRMAEKHEPLTLEVLRTVYHGLLKTYFGDAMVIDEVLGLECFRIPHFYSPFYVYKYATGISAAIALAARVLSEGEMARNAYLKFLTLGGSKYPLDELVDAGVDMRSPEPVERAVGHFNDLVDRLIRLHGEI